MEYLIKTKKTEKQGGIWVYGNQLFFVKSTSALSILYAWRLPHKFQKVQNLDKQDWKPFQSQDEEYKWYEKQKPHSLFLRNTKELK